MRDIKFRAFDPVKNKMRFADICEVDEMAEWITWENPIDSPSNTGVGFEIMQFTGLQDKNGVDIYEGDIVKEMRLLNDGPCYCNVEVKYIAPSFKVRELPMSNYMGIEWEVIGNKFESPELLEQ